MKTLYKTITVDHNEKLDLKVNEYLEQGWELYGNPYTTGWRKVSEDTSFYWEIDYCQAIIKKIEE
jgi:hypothetical protein